MDDFDRSFYELMKKKYIIDRLAVDFNKRRLEFEQSLYHHDFGEIRATGLIHDVEKSEYQNFIETETNTYVKSVENLVNGTNLDIHVLMCGNGERPGSGFDDEITRSGYDSTGSVEKYYSVSTNDNEKTKETVTHFDIENVSEDGSACCAATDSDDDDDRRSRLLYNYDGVTGENGVNQTEAVDHDQCKISEQGRPGSDKERQAVFLDQDEETINYSEG